jgi:hypothetical protein
MHEMKGILAILQEREEKNQKIDEVKRMEEARREQESREQDRRLQERIE